VNVIFLHQHGRHHTSILIGHQVIHSWFDISTVPFPSPIHNTFIPHHLDTWHQGKFQSGADLFREKTLDLRGQQIKAVTFQHIPASIKLATSPLRLDGTVEGSGSISFGGLEIEVYVKSSQKYLESSTRNTYFSFISYLAKTIL
jgi:hypothetical protein